MGLTHHSVGAGAIDSGLSIQKRAESDLVVALAGNPNVGKSTIFNALTGSNQHTGNWPGKTVSNAQGYCKTAAHGYVLVDIPGTYSLMAHSAEEAVARNFICFGAPDAVVVVCDATCLERNLNLVLQTLEIAENAVVCVNLMDEAKRKGICIDTARLAARLGVPVISTTARKRADLDRLMLAVDETVGRKTPQRSLAVSYPAPIEKAIEALDVRLRTAFPSKKRRRWLCLKLLDSDASLCAEINAACGDGFLEELNGSAEMAKAKGILKDAGLTQDTLRDAVVTAIADTAGRICRGAVTYRQEDCHRRDLRIDRVLTGRVTAYPLMLLLLAFIFFLTIYAANYPSALLSAGLFWVQDRLTDLFTWLHAPAWLHGALVLGVYRVLAWVVSVMLPPMAIFFPLFTLLEDVGYLPRLAYNLDKPFQRCHACGKQALTMCMGFGCNAAGVVGCRIIDSPRERLLAILTNNFVPCNGRFPTLIAVITMFFVGTAGGFFSSALSALLLTAVILLGIFATFGITRLLSETLLHGMPSSFTLELPPYRRPQIGKVIWRSLWDRTAFVLGRAAAVAAPAGLLIWLLANIKSGDISLLQHCADFLDPFARLLGMDGVILMAFILGFPANETVIPIIIMTYMAEGSLTELAGLETMHALFTAHGWTAGTAVSVILFSLFHWPCSTTLLTVKKETGSLFWTLLAALIPTVVGCLACMAANGIFHLFS